MTKHLVRNFFGLLVIYIIIIFGIFAIQFRTDLAIFENFLNFELRLSKEVEDTTVDSDSLTLSNSFNVIGNGFNIYCTEDSPVYLEEGNNYIPLILESWEKNSDTSFSLIFTKDILLTFTVDETSLEVYLDSPNNSDTVIIPYQTEKIFSPVDLSDSKVVIQSEDKMYSLWAGNITEKTMSLSHDTKLIASISPHEQITAFTFSSTIGQTNTTQTELDTAVRVIRSNIISAFDPSSSSNNEKFVASYIAERSLIGEYDEAISSISESFTSGKNRSYFTAPYFNNLALMHETLVEETEAITFAIETSLTNKNLDAFTLANLGDYLQRSRLVDVKDFLLLPSQLASYEPTVYQATGILEVYVSLVTNRPELAELLEPVIEKTLTVIETNCLVQDNRLLLVVDDSVVSQDVIAKTGYVLQKIGELKNRQELKSAGIMMLISALENMHANDFAHVYTYYIDDNQFYPHGEIIGYSDDTPIWIWGILPEVTVEDIDDVLTFELHFPLGGIYHSIITGIKPFVSVQMRNIDGYPSDPQFESYLAPGYVYDRKNQTLLLRYAQKTEVEILKIFYKQIEVPEVIEEKISNETTTEETTIIPDISEVIY